MGMRELFLYTTRVKIWYKTLLLRVLSHKLNSEGSVIMSRLTIITSNKAQTTIERLYKDLERRIVASPPGLCPVDMAVSFLKLCHAQTCGKCVPCRIGLGQLSKMLDSVLDGTATMETLDQIKRTAKAIYYSADCAIGYEAAGMVLNGLKGFRDDYEEHILRGRCTFELYQPVPCVSQCPAGVDVPGYIALIAAGRNADAVRLIRKDNPMPAACAYICEHPCEARCRRNIIDDSVNIRALKRYAVDNAGSVPVPECASPTGKKVAVIGGGPGGLSAAYYLALMGHNVTIYEQRKKLGGMLRYGIPNYRLPRTVLDQEIESILSTGIQVHTETSVGKHLSILDLKKDYNAVYIAVGAQTDKKIGIDGENSEGVMSAVELLRAIGDDEPVDFTGKRVAVVGGGNVAMDVARSMKRLGAEAVYIVYRRRKEDMTALPDEIEGAIAEGCELLDLNAPVRIEADENGKVAAIWTKPQIIGPVKRRRPAPNPSDKDEQRIECDAVMMAVGQGIESQEFEKHGIPVKKGIIDALNDSDIKDVPGVFAGGDCVTGPATAIRAIAAGKVAAANIDEYLGFNHEIKTDVDIPREEYRNNPPCGRINLKERSAAERCMDFELVEQGMTAKECEQESHRCLRCDYFGFGSFKGGRVDKW